MADLVTMIKIKTLATGQSNRKINPLKSNLLKYSWSSCRLGFTLIELVICMLIISILMGAVIVTLPSTNTSKAVREEAERLTNLLEMTREIALIDSNEYAINTNATGYSWWKWQNDHEKWEMLTDKPHEQHKLPKGVIINDIVAIENLSISPDQTSLIIILTDGQITPFRLEILSKSDQTSAVVVETDGFSTITIH